MPKISQLPAAATLAGPELVPVVQGGVTVRTTAAAIAALGGGSSQPYNITIDSHTATPTFAANDEFDGATLDTSGTRFSGATPWSWFFQQGSVATLQYGSLFLESANSTDTTYSFIGQPTPSSSPTATYTYIAKIANAFSPDGVSTDPNYNQGGMLFYESSSGKILGFAFYVENGIPEIIALTGTASVGVVSFATAATYFYISGNADTVPSGSNWTYVRLQVVGGVATVAVSSTGLPGSFWVLYSTTFSAAFTVAPDTVGLLTLSGSVSNAPNILLCDWFRRFV